MNETTRPDEATYVARIARAADEVEATREAYRLAVEHRDAILVEACDEGLLSRGRAATAARVRRSRVLAILAEH